MRALRRGQSSSPSSPSSWSHLRSVLLVVNSSSPAYCSDRVHIKSPWSRRKRKRCLTYRLWRNSFTPEGRFHDGGVSFLKKVRSGGVNPNIRAEVWPFLLGVYSLDSTKEERDAVMKQKRQEYEKLRRQCRRLLKQKYGCLKLSEVGDAKYFKDDIKLQQDTDSSSYEIFSARDSLSDQEENASFDYTDESSVSLLGSYCDSSTQLPNGSDFSSFNSESSDSETTLEPEISSPEDKDENGLDLFSNEGGMSRSELHLTQRTSEDFSTWQRIIRVDAVRANPEWIMYHSSGTTVGGDRAHRAAEAVGLKEYDHLEPCRVFHAARLVAILEAYALFDPEIGYCQGMSDLLSPIITVIKEDHEAFWCFVGFMKKARHNFRLDEVGIRRQLNIVSKIIKCKDRHLYRHLEKLKAEDCFFVYRMVVVMFRRELSFEQTVCLWEVMWADQVAIRTGIWKSEWGKIRPHVPPTDDLLLYAIAASVLQRRKLIIEKYSSMEEILRECNSMAGHLDVWKLLDDAHDLVVTLHEKIERPV